MEKRLPPKRYRQKEKMRANCNRKKREPAMLENLKIVYALATFLGVMVLNEYALSGSWL
jgi:hypothetical protein